MSFMGIQKNKSMKAFLIFAAVLFAFQLCAACFLSISRWKAENADKTYSIYCDGELFKLLPDKSSLKQMGVSGVSVELDGNGEIDQTLCDEITTAGLAVLPTVGQENVDADSYFDLCRTYGSSLVLSDSAGFSENADRLLDENGASVILRETGNQLGNEQIPGIDQRLQLGRSTRMFCLSDEYCARYSYIGYEHGEEIENIFYRAVSERQIRVLLLRSFISADGSEISDPQAYEAVLSALQARLADKGYTPGAVPSVLTDFDYTAYMGYFRILSIASAIAILIFLLFTLLPSFGSGLCGILWVLGLGGALLLYKLSAAYFTMASIFLTAVSMSCLLFYVFYTITARTSAKTGAGSLALSAVSPLPLILIGGIVVSASMYGLSYKLELDYFVGVKLSMLLPVAYALALFVRREIIGKPRDERLISAELLKKHKALVIAVGILLLLAAAYYVMRIGNSALVSGFELRLRNWLEAALYARPRTKEIILGYPAFFLALYLAKRENPFAPAAAVFASVLTASAVNTFCHSRAPLAISMARSADSFLCGALAGAVLILVLWALTRAFTPKRLK